MQTAHGVLTVPVPATIELLRGFPVFQDGRRGELVTPTGAALARALGKPGPMPSMRPTATGYGAGTRNPEGWNNVTRLILGEPLGADEAADVPADEVEVISAQVDDMPGEALPALISALLAAGAADAFAAPVVMKKGRLGQLITAICAPERAGAVGDALLRHSTSFGLRRHRAWQRECRGDDAARVPGAAEIDALRPLIGWQQVQWDGRCIALPRNGMQIDLGGIGKEYAADRAAALLGAHGVSGGFVDLGGDIVVIGPRADASPWRVGLQHPRKAGALLGCVELGRGALATSGRSEGCTPKVWPALLPASAASDARGMARFCRPVW